MLHRCHLVACLALVGCWIQSCHGQATKEIAIISLEQVKDHVGEEIAVEFDVLSSTLIDAKKICFLNSKKNHRDADNFVVVIKSDSLTTFAKAEIPEPNKHFFGKRIQVRGKLTLHNKRPQILVTQVDQIRLLKSLPADQDLEDVKVANTNRTEQ